MKNLENYSVLELDAKTQISIDGGNISPNMERVIVFACFGLFGLAVYELSRNQCS